MVPKKACFKVIKLNMKLIICLIIVIALFFKVLNGSNPVISVFRVWAPLAGRSVVIDPGHGGIDGGTYHSDGTLEKDINLQVALKLKNLLEKSGVNVVMTRSSDVALDNLNDKSSYRHKRDLMARVDIINKSQPDLFISIHVNAEKSSPNTRGPMVFYYRQSQKSRELAVILQRRLNEAYNNSNQLVKERNPNPNSSMYLLCNTKCPGVIAELGFITNPIDRKMLKTEEFQNEISKAIANALKDYF